MPERNIMKIIKNTKKRKGYDMYLHEACLLLDNANSNINAVCNSFTFGYAQGMKAARAEIKSKGVLV